MTALKLESFGGIAPMIMPSKLADNMAVEAINVRFDAGGVSAWRDLGSPLTTVATSAAVQSLYRFDNNWLVSSFPRQYVKGLQPSDSFNRLYFTDSNYPKVYSNGATYRLGLPRPSAPIGVITTEGDKTVLTDVRDQSYVVTIVDAFGTEGPSSLPTQSFEVGKGGVVTLNLTPCQVSGNYNLGTGALFRIYRTNTGSEGAIFQYVDQVPYGTASYADSVDPSDLQEELQSADWVAAPDDNATLYPYGPLASLVEYPGGILAGHSGKTVYLTVPYVPTAWPYSYTISELIVGLVVIQSGLLILTQGKPYLLTGTSPDAMAMVPIESYQPCVSARSIVDLGDYAIYASPNGLVLAQGNTVELITEGLFDTRTWQTYLGNPATIRAYEYRGRYVAHYGGATSGIGFIFDPAAEENAFTKLTVEAAAGWYDPAAGNLYVIHQEAPGTPYPIYQFDSGSFLPTVWESKLFQLPDWHMLHAVRVEMLIGTCMVTTRADGVVRGPYTFTNNKPARLPGGYRARDFQVRLANFEAIEWVQFAESMGELD